MGLVARRDFVGNDGHQYKAGDPCDDALSWRYPALRGCLNMGLIEDTDGTVDKHMGRVSDGELAILRAERRASRRATARAAAAICASTPVAAGESVPCPEPAADLSAAGVSEDDGDNERAAAPPAAAAQVSCTDCGKLFASEHAMRIHHGKAHRG